jgi:hypothetical protein
MGVFHWGYRNSHAIPLIFDSANVQVHSEYLVRKCSRFAIEQRREMFKNVGLKRNLYDPVQGTRPGGGNGLA